MFLLSHFFLTLRVLKTYQSDLEILTLALISVAPLLLLTSPPFLSPPSLFSLVSPARLFLFSLVFPFLAHPLVSEPLLSFSLLQL